VRRARRSSELPPAEKREPLTEFLILGELSARTHVPSNVLRNVFTELSAMMDDELFGHGGSRQFVLPQLGYKILLRAKAATEEREMRSPASGEMIMVSAKPATWKLAARFLKGMKDGIKLMEPPTEEDF